MKEKIQSSQKETPNQDKGRRARMRLKKLEKEKPDQVSGKKEPRHQQETQSLKKTSQDKVVIKIIKLKELIGLLQSPRDAKTPPKTLWLQLLSQPQRSFTVLVVKWLFRPPVARELKQGSENKWQKEQKSKRLTKRSSDSLPSKRRKPKRELLKSKSELKPPRERKAEDYGTKRRLRRNELKQNKKNLIRPLVLLFNKRIKKIRSKLKKKVN
mgnify:CR=1 FL=1